MRFPQMNAQRDKQRQDFIKRGLLPDPEKRTSLEDAMTVVPLCEDMCPEFEREQREYQNNVDPLERIPGTSRIDHTRAVKQYHRPAAGEEAPLPTDIRTPGALVRSLNYLFNELMLEHPFEVTHPFIRDRTRSIRAELTMIREQGSVAISLTERIARWHLLALGEMRGKVGFQEQQELEQLRKGACETACGWISAQLTYALSLAHAQRALRPRQDGSATGADTERGRVPRVRNLDPLE